MSKTVKVELVPVTTEQSEMLSEAAQSLYWLAKLTGLPKYKAQSDIVNHFSGRDRGMWNPRYELPVEDD
jgi:hypothetical protein